MTNILIYVYTQMVAMDAIMKSSVLISSTQMASKYALELWWKGITVTTLEAPVLDMMNSEKWLLDLANIGDDWCVYTVT